MNIQLDTTRSDSTLPVYILQYLTGDSLKLVFLVNIGRLEATDQIEQRTAETLDGMLGFITAVAMSPAPRRGLARTPPGLG